MINSIISIILITALVITFQTSALAGEWGAGIAAATQQTPQTGIKNEILAAPYIKYEGDHLKVDLGAISYLLYNKQAVKLSILGECRFDGYDPDNSSALSGMEQRDPTFDAGFKLAHTDNRGVFELALLGDITGTHNGIESRAMYQYPYLSGHLLLVPSMGVSWLNESLVDYYYGVRKKEANTYRRAYSGHDAINAVTEFSIGYMFSDDMEVLVGIQYVYFDKSISDSPIIDRDSQTTAITTLVYKF